MLEHPVCICYLARDASFTYFNQVLLEWRCNRSRLLLRVWLIFFLNLPSWWVLHLLPYSSFLIMSLYYHSSLFLLFVLFQKLSDADFVATLLVLGFSNEMNEFIKQVITHPILAKCYFQPYSFILSSIFLVHIQFSLPLLISHTAPVILRTPSRDQKHSTATLLRSPSLHRPRVAVRYTSKSLWMHFGQTIGTSPPNRGGEQERVVVLRDKYDRVEILSRLVQPHAFPASTARQPHSQKSSTASLYTMFTHK